MAHRTVLVGDPDQYLGLLEGAEPGGEHLAGDAALGEQLLEPRAAAGDVADHQHGPGVAEQAHRVGHPAVVIRHEVSLE